MRRALPLAALFLATTLALTWLGSVAPRGALLTALALHALAVLALLAFNRRIRALDFSHRLDNRASSLASKATSRVRSTQFAGIILLSAALATVSGTSRLAPLFVVCLALGFNLGALLALALTLLAQARLLSEIRETRRSPS